VRGCQHFGPEGRRKTTVSESPRLAAGGADDTSRRSATSDLGVMFLPRRRSTLPAGAKGPELGISTQKVHARGPMALPGLTTYKFVVYGSGQVPS